MKSQVRRIMKKFLYGVIFSALIFVSLGVCQAQETKTFGDNWTHGNSRRGLSWKGGYAFTQKLKAKADGSLSLLFVYMGTLSNPYSAPAQYPWDFYEDRSQPISARLVIKINGDQVFDKTFEGLKQMWQVRGQAPATRFSLEGISREVKIGDEIKLQITPDREVMMWPVISTNGDWSLSTFGQKGEEVALRFQLR
jgi:hypothetical protein